MRRLVVVGALVAAAACSRENPQFGDDEGAADGSGGTAAASTGGPGDGTLGPGETTAGQDGSGDTAGAETKGPSDTGAPEADVCDADLYAINDLGELFVVDVDGPSQVRMMHDVQDLASWALATHPKSGALHYTRVGDPTVVWWINPITFQLDPTPIPIPGVGWTDFARAAFDDEGNLWLGTQSSGRFAGFAPQGGFFVEYQVNGVGAGGDMLLPVFGYTMVPANGGTMYFVDFETSIVIPTQVPGVAPTVEFTGVAHDRAGRMWTALSDPPGTLLQIEPSVDGGGNIFVDIAATIAIGIRINDLAPVVVLPGGC